MSRVVRFGIPVLLVMTVLLAGLWIRGERDKVRLSRELRHAQDRLAEERALNGGLEEANRRLRARLQEIPVLTVTGDASPMEAPPEAFPPPESEWEFLAMDEALPGEGDSEVASDATLTPDEREALERARAEWRAEREKRREDFRARMTEDLRLRRDFFSLINPEGLAPEYAASNRRLLEALGEMEVNVANLGDPELTREERREMGRALWRTRREVDELMGLQKEILLNDYAELELGLDAGQTRSFIDYMRTVEAYTSMPGGAGWGGRRGGGR